MTVPEAGYTAEKMVETRGMKRRVDYISALPDAVILHILSFLPMRDCIILSFVSKRWRTLWTQVSSLNLEELEIISPHIRKSICPTCRALPSPNSTSCKMHIIEAARKKFADSVDRIMLLHSGCTIDKLRLSCNYEPYAWHARKVDTWVKLAFTSDVREIELSFFDKNLAAYLSRHGFRRSGANPSGAYQLPKLRASPRLLNSLTLHHCIFRASNFKSFELLKRLVMDHVGILDSSVTMLASRSPVLEDLRLDHCIIRHDFLVSEEHLVIKRLVMSRCRSPDMHPIRIDISTPHLESLTVTGLYVTTLPYVRRATKPLDATIDIRAMSDMNEQGIDLSPFLVGLQRCRALTLSSWTIQALPAEGTMIRQPHIVFPHLIHLSLLVGLGRQELPRIIHLLGRCKNLELISIDVTRTLSFVGLNHPEHANRAIPGFDEDNFWQSQDWPYCCSQKHLRKIKVTGFTGATHQMNLLRFLLAKAEVLDRMSISYTVESTGQSLLAQEASRQLMWFDRASKSAQLWFSPIR